MITKRTISVYFMLPCVLLLALALGACSQDSCSTDSNTRDEVVATPFETVANADDAGFEIKEVTFLTDEEIAGLVESLQSEYAYDYVATQERAKENPEFPLSVTGYHTDSTELSVARGIPAYTYDDGAFEPTSGGVVYYVFDEGVPHYRLEPWVNGPYMFYPSTDDNGSEDCPTTEEVFAESATKEFCLIQCAQGNVLYDGVNAWVMSLGSWADMDDYLDYLNDDLVSTPGIEDLELGTILERQTFVYESPTD